MTIITPTELALLRTRPHYTRLYLSVYRPTVLATATVASGYDRGTIQIEFENVTGDLNDVVNGMTVWVGSSPGDNDLGKLRIKDLDIPNNLLTLPENSVVWSLGSYLTFLEFFEVWPVYPRIVYDGDDIPTFYKDYDIPYSDQNSIFDPVPMMGPHLAGMLEGGQKQFYFDASDSYDLTEGATTLSYSWTFPGGTPSSSSAATPGLVTWTAPGHYTVSLTVTSDATTRTFTSYRHVSVYTPIGGDNPPFVNWSTNSLRGDLSSGGWAGQILLRENADKSVIVDGALVVIFSVDKYGDTQQSIGGNYPNREDIVFVGYIRDGSISIDPETNAVTFSVTNLQGKMQSRELYAVSVVSSSAPTGWYYLKNMTVDKIIYHLLRWHTTVYNIADVQPNGNTLQVERADFSRSFMFGTLNQFLQSTILGNAAADRQGKLWLETRIDLVPIESRTLGTAITLTRADWMNSLDISYTRENKTSYVEINGFYYTGPADDAETALISCAPGLAPSYEGAPTSIAGLVLESQTQSNQLAGNILAAATKQFQDVGINFSGNYRILDIAPQERVVINLSDTENWTGIQWINKPFIPTSIDIAYNSQQSSMLIRANVSEESDGPAGISGPYPRDMGDTEPVDTPAPDGDVPPLPGPGEGSANNTFAVTSSKIGFTQNLLASSPTWQDRTGAVTGTIVDFLLDPYAPKTTAYCLTTTGVWKTNNITHTLPTWVKLIDIVGGGVLQFASNLSPSFNRMKASISGAGRFRVLAYAKAAPADVIYQQYCYVTNNGGTSWARYATGGTGGGTAQFDFDTDMEGWAYTTDRTVAIGTAQGGDCDYFTDYGDWWSWSSVNGRTTPGCLYALKSGSQPSFFAPGASTVKYDLTRVVAENDIALDVWYSPDPINFSPELLLRVIFTDNTSQDLFVDITGSGYQNAQLVISAANDGKTTSYVMLGWCICGFDWTGPNGAYIDDVKVFGVGTGTPTTNAFDAGQHSGNIFYAGTGASIRRTTNGGPAWATYIASKGAYDIECHYNGNASDADLTFWSTDGNLYRTVGTSIGSSKRTESPVSEKNGRIVSYVNDKDVIYILRSVGSDVFDLERTVNGGSSWTTLISSIAGAKAIGLWPWGTFNPATQGVFLLSGTQILYSTTGGSSFSNKTGNWATVMGASFSNPVMIVPIWVA